MIGHGRPAFSSLALACAALILCACMASIAAAQNQASSEPTQLRITWGGGDPVRWVGRIGVDEGTISNLKMLEAEPDAVGSIWLEEGQLRAGASQQVCEVRPRLVAPERRQVVADDDALIERLVDGHAEAAA